MVQFRKSKSFGPFRITATKRGISTSFGAGPIRLSRGADGKTRRTIRAPGTGVFDTKVISGKARKRAKGKPVTEPKNLVASDPVVEAPPAAKSAPTAPFVTAAADSAPGPTFAPLDQHKYYPKSEPAAPAPTGRGKKWAAVVGGAFALLASFGIGAAVSGGTESTSEAAPASTTVTETRTATRTVTETTTARAAAAAAESTAPATPTTTARAAEATTPTATPDTAIRGAVPAPRTETATQAPPPAADSGGAVYYRNCSAVRAAGAAPIYRGSPGYGSHLDRDGDGIACE